MNTGTLTIEWLYSEQLQVDDSWSVRRSDGFTWWPDRNAQQIEVIGKETNENGENAYFVRVKTEVIKDLSLTDKTLVLINLLMPTPTMAGLVHDSKTGVLSLSSLVRVHEGIRGWMSPLISVAAMLQISDAYSILEVVGGKPAHSGHPTSGQRPSPDALVLEFSSGLATTGAEPSRWNPGEFQDAVDQYMQQFPSLLATAGGPGLTVEFPYGDRSSLCQIQGDQAHPWVGNGLFLHQTFPVSQMSDLDGIRLALEINANELDRRASGYGFGSYCFSDGFIHFTGFIPNLAYRRGLLSNLCFSCAERARAMSIRFMNDDWSNISELERTSMKPSLLSRIGGLFRRK